MTDLPSNDRLAQETFRDGIKVDVSKYPSTKVQLSPRLGFNYKPLDDSSLQLRGGTGIFTGTPPYVWLSNQAGNNGVLFGDINIQKIVDKKTGNVISDNRPTLGFTGDINSYKPAQGTAPRGDIAITDPKFKYPTIWKTDLAADYRFLDGWIATVEFLHSKDLNAIYHDNIGIERTSNFVKDGSGQNVRPVYGNYYSNEAAYNVVMLRNTNEGYSWFTTLQLQKDFRSGTFKGLNFNGSYIKPWQPLPCFRRS